LLLQKRGFGRREAALAAAAESEGEVFRFPIRTRAVSKPGGDLRKSGSWGDRTAKIARTLMYRVLSRRRGLMRKMRDEAGAAKP
jgi:hypothetical protein